MGATSAPKALTTSPRSLLRIEASGHLAADVGGHLPLCGDVEGAADRSPDQFKSYLGMALGSLNELQTQAEISKRLGYFDEQLSLQVQNAIDECTGLVYGLKKSIS